MFRSTPLLRHFSSTKIRIPLWMTFVLIALPLIGSLIALLPARLMASIYVPCSKENLTGTVQTISPVSETGSTTIGLITQGDAAVITQLIEAGVALVTRGRGYQILKHPQL